MGAPSTVPRVRRTHPDRASRAACRAPAEPDRGRADATDPSPPSQRKGPTMNDPAAITITPVFVADLLVEDGRMPVYVHVIDHPAARVLVDTGLTELHPLVADMDPRLRPLSTQEFDLAGIDIVVNTHLHFDHCGGNVLFPGGRSTCNDRSSRTPGTRRTTPSASGSTRPICGTSPSTASSTLPGVRLVPAPGHTRGTQVVVVETRRAHGGHRRRRGRVVRRARRTADRGTAAGSLSRSRSGLAGAHARAVATPRRLTDSDRSRRISASAPGRASR